VASVQRSRELPRCRVDGVRFPGGRYLCLDVDDGCTRQVEADFRVGGNRRAAQKHPGDFFFAQRKNGPDTVASRGQVPRSSPRLPPVMAEGDMRGAFLARKRPNILIRVRAI
jgi:hypothetical protein